MSDWARNLDTFMDGYEEPTNEGHTPGPWDWTDEGAWPDGISIAEVGDYNIIVEDGTQGSEEADARLIASAPALLDACQEAYTVAEKISATLPSLHPADILIRGLRSLLKHVIEDATGEAPA